MFLRYRMNKLIRLLEKNDSKSFNAAIGSDKYLKALDALEDERCVRVVRDMGGNIHNVWLLNHYATFQLSRQDVWGNRFWGFLFGVATTVVAELLLYVILR